MAPRIRDYETRLKSFGDGSVTFLDLLIGLIRDIDARISVNEDATGSIVALQQQLITYGTALVDSAIVDAVAAIEEAADLGTIFTGRSTSSAVIGTGMIDLTIGADQRLRFAPGSMLIMVDTENPEQAMWGRKVAYVAETGVLTVDVFSFTGSGIVSSWIITPGAVADMAGKVSVAASGLISAGTLQAALADLSAAIADDPAFAGTVAALLADRYTKDETDDLLAAGLGAKLNLSSYTASDVLAKLVTVDGAGSGIDADLLDGKTSSEFQPADALLLAIAALVTANGKIIKSTGPDTVTLIDLVGSVAAGAVFETGANANGEYVRFLDGTQECWMPAGLALDAPTANGGVFRNTSAVDWIYPALFVGTPVPVGSVQDGPSWANCHPKNGYETTIASVYRWRTGATAVTQPVRLSVKGRWK